MTRLAERFPGMLMAAGVVLYLGAATGLGRFVQLDEVFFKAAGREWAATWRFAAPEIQGVPTADPPGFLEMQPPLEQVWLAQMPGYTFLFGLYARILGFGPTQCVLFDALIHAWLAVQTFRLAQILLPARPLTAVLAGFLVLPLGTLARPDELAMCLGLSALFPFATGNLTPRRLATSACLFGLCTATSAGASILLGLVAATQCLLLRPAAHLPAGLAHRLLLLIGWSGLALAVATIALLPILIPHPEAWRQYSAHAQGHFWQRRYGQAFAKSWGCGKPYLAIVAGSFLVAALSWPAAVNGGRRRHWLMLWLGPLLGFVFLGVFLPDKYLYTWMLGPWMIVASLALFPCVLRWWPPMAVRIVVAVLGSLYALGASPCLQNVLIMALLPESQTLAHNARLVEAMVPPGSRVVTDDYWWVLANRCRVFDPYFSRKTISEIDYVILAGDGSGDPQLRCALPPSLAAAARNLHCVLDNIGGRPLRVLGRRLPNTGYGFGVAVLRHERSVASGQAIAEFADKHW